MSVERPQKVEVTVSNRTVVRVILLSVLSIFAIAILRKLGHAFTLIFFSAFLAIALNPAVSWLNRKIRIKSRLRATAITYILVLAFLASFFSLVIPPLVQQTTDFVSDVPATISSFKNRDTSLSRFVFKYNLDDQLTELGTELSGRAGELRSGAVSAASKVGSAIISLITVLILTFMMLVEGPTWLEHFWALQPAARRERRKRLVHKFYGVITGYVNGQLLITTIAASFALVALIIASTIFDASINPMALAGIVALFGLIPLIGNTLAAVIVVLACLLVSTPLALVMIVFFILYQQVENATIQPYIQARKNELTALLVFIAALLGASFGGLVGAFVAIPAAGCIKIVIEDILQHRAKTSN